MLVVLKRVIGNQATQAIHEKGASSANLIELTNIQASTALQALFSQSGTFLDPIANRSF